MASRGSYIKGITVEIGGDTSGLNKALSSTNSKIRDTQSQLKDVERLLKLDPTNTKLLEQRQRLLAEAVQETKNKLSTLKDAEKQAQQQFKEGKISQEQYDALTREIVDTEHALKELEKAASSSNATLSSISATADKFGAAADTIASKTKVASGAAAGLLGTLGGLAVKAGQTADEINTMARNTGFSTDTIQKWQYASDRIDVSVDSIGKAAQSLTKNMKSTSSDTQAAFQKLGVSATNLEGQMRPAEDVFWDVVDGLSQIENETERDQLAMTLLGKSASDLSGIIDDGGKAFRELGKEAEELGVILDEDALANANALNDSIDKIKAQAAGTFAEVGAEIAEDLLPIMEKLMDIMAQVLGWIASLDSSQLEMIATILAVVAAISPLAKAVSGLMSLISGVSTAISFLLANPIVALVAGIVALVALIATKGDEIQNVLKKVDSFLQNVFATDWTTVFGPILGDVLNGFFANLKNTWDAIYKVLNGVIDFVRGAFTGDWKRAWQGVKDIFTGMFDGLASFLKRPLNAVISMINGAIGSINVLIEGVNKIPGVNVGTIGKIPYLANGGIVSQGSAVVGEAGPELLTVSGGRAIVQPLTAAGPSYTTNSQTFGNINFQIYAADGADADDIADTVMERIQELVERRT